MVEILGIKFITDKEASKRYGYSESWFRYRRREKLQPHYMQLGNGCRILYPMEETDKWFKENMQHKL